MTLQVQVWEYGALSDIFEKAQRMLQSVVNDSASVFHVKQYCRRMERSVQSTCARFHVKHYKR